jgi:hypothetical protein
MRGPPARQGRETLKAYITNTAESEFSYTQPHLRWQMSRVALGPWTSPGLIKGACAGLCFIPEPLSCCS